MGSSARATTTAGEFLASCIEARVNNFQRAGADGYYEEFVSLYEQEEEQEAKGLVSWTESQKSCNWEKNRFSNILPFDHSRVILREPWPHDYINASYVRPDRGGMFEGCTKMYIAAQGALSSTISDFWYMIWQENSRAIVCMTKEFEGSHRKCAHYWPEPGEVKVLKEGLTCTHLKETLNRHDEFTLREFSLALKESSEETRIIYQFHFNGWPDHGVPKNPGSVLNFVWQVNERQRQQNPDNVGPIVVHCSGGIGRTGTYIVIDLIIDAIRRKGLDTLIDVQKTVQMVRTQRGGMVETRAQYQFVYLAIAQHVSTMSQRIQAYKKCLEHGDGTEYTNLKFPSQTQKTEFSTLDPART